MDLSCATKYMLVLSILVKHHDTSVKSSIHRNDHPGYTPVRKLTNLAKDQGIGIGNIQRRDVNADQHGETIQENPCKLQGSCKVNDVSGMIPVCYCDDACSVYHDCCHDNNPLTMTKANLSVVTDKIEYITCETKTLHTISDFVFGYFMVSKCPHEVQDNYPNMSKLCQTAAVSPVTSEDGVTYKNLHCSFCHGVQKYLIWTVAFYYNGNNCNVKKISNSNFTYLEKIHHIREHCDSWFIPPKSTTFRFCAKSKEIDNATNENDLCSKFQNPISTDKRFFGHRTYHRNAHCNEVQAGDGITCLQREQYVTFEGKGFAGLSLTGIFNVRPKNGGSEDKCQTRQSLEIKCSNCDDQSTEVCVEELLKNYKYKLRQNFVTNGIIDSSTVFRVLTFIYMSWPVQKYGIYFNDIIGMHWCSKDSAEPCCGFQGGMVLTITEARTYEQVSSLITDVSNMDWTYREKHVDKDLQISNVEDGFSHCSKTRKLTRYVQKNRQEIKKNIEIFRKYKTVSEYVPITVNGTINVIDTINSSFVVESWEATYQENNNASLSNSTATAMTLNTKWGPKSILTYLTLGLSCLSLLVTMSVYQYLGLFKSNDGKITRHMMLSLFTAQLFFITAVGANFIYEVCLVIAALSHYLWLCTFSWMSLFCVHVLHKMRTMRSSPGSLVLKEQLSYPMIFLGYIFPACFVVPCVLLDILTNIPIEYNGEICFISGYPANLIAFTVPVVISILTNITALITTSVLISRYNNTRKSLSTVNITRSFIPRYIRSCVLCAFPWILGIVADIFHSDILDYVFIILAGSHGIFVSLSFISTQNVANKLRFLFRNGSENPQNIELSEMN